MHICLSFPLRGSTADVVCLFDWDPASFRLEDERSQYVQTGLFEKVTKLMIVATLIHPRCHMHLPLEPPGI